MTIMTDNGWNEEQYDVCRINLIAPQLDQTIQQAILQPLVNLGHNDHFQPGTKLKVIWILCRIVVREVNLGPTFAGGCQNQLHA